MKKLIAGLLLLSMLVVGLVSCKRTPETAPTCEEVRSAYEAAGYHTFHCTEVEAPMNCYVKVWLDDEYNYAFFHFFETPEEAEARDDERNYNIFIYLFSIIYGNPSWLRTKTYGNIQYEYDDPALIKPFKELIK